MVEKYFVNCRGATFNKVHVDEWDKSGGMPRLSTPFTPYREDFNADLMTFVGSTKTSNWLHWDTTEASQQLDYLKSVGVNLIRVYGDMFYWAQRKDHYLSSVSNLAELCNDKKMYIQWVLFDGYTEGDTSSTNHELGYFDPSTPYECVSWGIKRWQRCPNVNKNDLHEDFNYWKLWYGIPDRTVSTMTASGDAYIADMVSSVGGYRATLSWEVMHDVNILPTEAEGYDFLVSAINKINYLKSRNQKTTFSSKYLNVLSSTLSTGDPTLPDVYNEDLIKKVVPLVDYVCELTSNFTTQGFVNSYLRLKSFSEKTGKPVLLVDSFNDSLITPYSLFNFSKDFTIGCICEGMVDRSFSRKPNNSTKGIFFDDGEVRRLKDAISLVDKASKDGIGFFSLKTPLEKSVFDTLQGNTTASSFERFNVFGEVGDYSWSSIYNASRSFPEYSSVPVGYLPAASSFDWGVVGDASSYSGSGLFDTLQGIRDSLINTPLSGFSDDVARDKFGYKILVRLIKLTQDLDLYKGHNYYNQENYLYSDTSGFIASSYQESVFSSASAFMPRSITKDSDYNASPFIGTPRYFSSIASPEGRHRDNAYYFQKPICYWLRPSGFASGCCFYSSPIDVNVMDSSVVNVVDSYIDWSAYDIKLRDWADNLYNAYVNFNNNLRDYLINVLADYRFVDKLTEQSYIS